uniref:Uncharacterized protein n=1 Tax=Oryzias sinensis TaxID=183150 RepID=A0A8C7WSY0_9TELE
MARIFHSVLFWCLLVTLAHCMELDVNPELKKRLSIWLESRMKRDLDSTTAEKTAETQHFVTPEDIRDTLLPHSSSGSIVQTKRSKISNSQSRRQGCSLGTCTVHDLAHRLQHRLHELNHLICNTLLSSQTAWTSLQVLDTSVMVQQKETRMPGRIPESFGAIRPNVHVIAATI